MPAPQPSSIVIACPHCGTRYQVPPETVGPKGRQVACAHCGKSWLAERPAPPPPPPVDDDRLFSPADEEKLDKGFVAEEQAVGAQAPTPLKSGLRRGEVPPPEVVRSIAEIKAALTPKAKSAEAGEPDATPPAAGGKPMSKAWGLLRQRQLAFSRTLPTARLSRAMRFVGFGLLAGILVGGVLLRTEIVRVAPDLAGLYGAIGLEVNVVGLDFSEVSTLVSRRGDADVISVNATIVGLETHRVPVPAVIVTLLDAAGKSLYQWSVVTRARDLEPGEVVALATELNSPPAGVASVRLSFAEGLASGDAPITPTQISEEAAH